MFNIFNHNNILFSIFILLFIFISSKKSKYEYFYLSNNSSIFDNVHNYINNSLAIYNNDLSYVFINDVNPINSCKSFTSKNNCNQQTHCGCLWLEDNNIPLYNSKCISKYGL